MSSRVGFIGEKCKHPSPIEEADAATREKKVAALLQLAEEGDAAQRELAALGLPGPFKVGTCFQDRGFCLNRPPACSNTY